MTTPPLLPITGERFDELLELIDPDRKSEVQATAWQVVQQQVQSFSGPSSGSVDLNRIFLDMLRLELLVFPILEDWKSPLNQNEWNRVEQQAEALEELQEKVRKLSIQVRKKDPQGYVQYAELFNRFFSGSEILRGYWGTFREEWKTYKQQWELILARRKRAREREEAAKGESGEAQSSRGGTEVREEDIPLAPPLFRRDQWLALGQIGIFLDAELRQRCARYLKEPPPPGLPHPAVRLLVQELQQIYLRTQGFELLEKIQLVQQRNAQLIQELQALFPEPIISDAIRAQEQQERDREPAPVGGTPERKTSLKPLLLMTLGLGVAAVAVFLLMQLVPGVQQQPLKPLKFEPKGNTLSARNPSSQDPQQIKLEETINLFGLDLSTRQDDSRLMALTQGSEAERNSATRSFLEELGKDANFLFTQAGAYFLFWKGEVKRMLTTGELQQMLTRLKAQTEELKTLVQQFGSDRSRIVPETLDGEPVYALEVESADGETVQLYTNAEGVRMRMSNGQFLEESLSPAEARSRLGLR